MACLLTDDPITYRRMPKIGDVVTTCEILADLGVSSHQFDEAERGFSFRFDAPLDMRMDRSAGLTLAQWLNSVDEAELAKVIWDYGEERFAKQVAKAIVAARQGGP